MDNAFEILKLLGRGGIHLHFNTIGRIARHRGIDLTDSQILHILSTDPRFEKIDIGVYYIKGKRAGRRIDEEELEKL